MKQEEVDVFKIGFKVVGESANGGKTIMRTVWLVRSITSPWKLGNLPLLCRKTIWIKFGSVLKKMRHFWGNPSPIFEKTATDLGKISRRLWENQPLILENSVTDFGKFCHGFRENEPPILGKSVTDFGKKLPPALQKSATDFGRMSHRFWGNPSPILGKSVTVFGKLRFWKNRLGFRERLARF